VNIFPCIPIIIIKDENPHNNLSMLSYQYLKLSLFLFYMFEGSTSEEKPNIIGYKTKEKLLMNNYY
jgi:hypothetical protein